MKRIFSLILMLAVLLVFMAACGSDADYEEQILGKWYFFDVEDKTYDPDHYIIFKSNGTAEQCYKGKTDRIIYAQWRVDNATLVMMDEDGEEHGRAEIQELTNTRLKAIECDGDGEEFVLVR